MILADVRDHPAHARPDHGLGNAEADAAGAARDERHLALDNFHACSAGNERGAPFAGRASCSALAPLNQLKLRWNWTYHSRGAPGWPSSVGWPKAVRSNLLRKYSLSVRLVAPSATRQVSSGLAHSLRAFSSS